MGRLYYVKTLRDPVYTKLCLVKDYNRPGYFVEKSLMVNIEFQKKLFTNEITVHRQLEHRYIIKFIEQVGEFAFLMEYASWGNLQKVIDSTMTEKERIHIIINALKGLQYVHEMGYSHNDIKPTNILITGENRAKLSDFAFCGIKDTVTFSEIPSYFYMGTQFFRPPGERVSYVNRVANDIYAIGKVLYLLFSNLKKPHEVVMDSVLNHKIRDLIKHCLNDSYSSIEPVIEALKLMS